MFINIKIIIIIIKTSDTGPSEKNKIVYQLISQPYKYPNWTETENNTTFHPRFRCQTLGIGTVIPDRNLGRQERPCKLGRSAP